MTEDETVGCHHQLDGHEFEQALGVGDGPRSLACYIHPYSLPSLSCLASPFLTGISSDHFQNILDTLRLSFRLHWVFAAVLRRSPVAVLGLLVAVASPVAALRLECRLSSCGLAQSPRGLFPDQGSNSCPSHCQADS